MVPFPDGVICACHRRRTDEAASNKKFIHAHVSKNNVRCPLPMVRG